MPITVSPSATATSPMAPGPAARIDGPHHPISSHRLAKLLGGVTAEPDAPAYRNLARGVRALVLDGRISLHTRLPAERELAAVLRLSRTTVTAAYDLLRESGYAASRRGSGTWITLPPGSQVRTLGGWLEPSPSELIDLSCASPAAQVDMLSEALATATMQLPAHAATPGYHPYGLPELRQAIADRYTERGLATTADQILVTAGAQHAFSLTLRLVCTPGDRVLVENPTYPTALEAVRQAGLRAVPVPIAEGWDADVIDAMLRQTAPRLAYLIPDFQNPTGQVMPESARRAVSAAARRSGTWLVVDETMSEMVLDIPRQAPFAAVGGGDHVITTGSMSKSHWGGLRIGWLRASARVINELAALRITADMGGSVLDQLVAVPLMRRIDEVLDLRLTEVRAQRQALAGALRRELPDWNYRMPEGGFSFWVDLGDEIASQLVRRAESHGIRIDSGSKFGADPGTFERWIRLPYSLPVPVLEDVVCRLRAALHATGPLPLRPDRPDWVA